MFGFAGSSECKRRISSIEARGVLSRLICRIAEVGDLHQESAIDALLSDDSASQKIVPPPTILQ
jgi:hypothetical protein